MPDKHVFYETEDNEYIFLTEDNDNGIFGYHLYRESNIPVEFNKFSNSPIVWEGTDYTELEDDNFIAKMYIERLFIAGVEIYV